MRTHAALLAGLAVLVCVLLSSASGTHRGSTQSQFRELDDMADGASVMTLSSGAVVNITSCVPLASGACECTATKCDFVPPVGWTNITGNTIASYRTSKSHKERLVKSYLVFSDTPPAAPPRNILTINPKVQYQSVVGFGGAFTDAAAVNWLSLDSSLRELLIASYYAQNGLQYSLGRVPVASCDFSTHSYSYCDTPGDLNLTTFSVLVDQTSGKATLIQEALKLRQVYGANITLFGSSWSAPAWMKTTNSRVGGQLNGTAGDALHKSYAKYLSMFISEYKKQFGIDISMLTVQNEPNSKPPTVNWDSMLFTAETERDFIKLDLGPTIKGDHPGVLLLMHDDQRNTLPSWGKTILSDPAAAKYVDGAAFHWYEAVQDLFPDFQNLAEFHGNFSDKFLLATEACAGYLPTSPGPKLGDFDRGETYLFDIIGDMNNWATGWTDWNICLSLTGGPNWAGNYVDAPILIDPTDPHKFYKQPLFYAMGHVSAFVQPGSKRVDATFAARDTAGLYGLEATAFVTPDGKHVVVVLLNRDPQIDRTLLIVDSGTNKTVEFDVPSHSMQTLIYSAV